MAKLSPNLNRRDMLGTPQRPMTTSTRARDNRTSPQGRHALFSEGVFFGGKYQVMLTGAQLEPPLPDSTASTCARYTRNALRRSTPRPLRAFSLALRVWWHNAPLQRPLYAGRALRQQRSGASKAVRVSAANDCKRLLCHTLDSSVIHGLNLNDAGADDADYIDEH